MKRRKLRNEESKSRKEGDLGWYSNKSGEEMVLLNRGGGGKGEGKGKRGKVVK